jgi:hypothetical protein
MAQGETDSGCLQTSNNRVNVTEIGLSWKSCENTVDQSGLIGRKKRGTLRPHVNRTQGVYSRSWLRHSFEAAYGIAAEAFGAGLESSSHIIRIGPPDF